MPSPWFGSILIAIGVLCRASPLWRTWTVAHRRLANLARVAGVLVVGIACIKTAPWIWTRLTPPPQRVYVQLDRVAEAYARGATGLESEQLAKRFVGDWVR